jgi:hypothetical protein
MKTIPANRVCADNMAFILKRKGDPIKSKGSYSFKRDSLTDSEYRNSTEPLSGMGATPGSKPNLLCTEALDIPDVAFPSHYRNLAKMDHKIGYESRCGCDLEFKTCLGVSISDSSSRNKRLVENVGLHWHASSCIRSGRSRFKTRIGGMFDFKNDSNQKYHIDYGSAERQTKPCQNIQNIHNIHNIQDIQDIQDIQMGDTDSDATEEEQENHSDDDEDDEEGFPDNDFNVPSYWFKREEEYQTQAMITTGEESTIPFQESPPDPIFGTQSSTTYCSSILCNPFSSEGSRDDETLICREAVTFGEPLNRMSKYIVIHPTAPEDFYESDAEEPFVWELPKRNWTNPSYARNVEMVH